MTKRLLSILLSGLVLLSASCSDEGETILNTPPPKTNPNTPNTNTDGNGAGSNNGGSNNGGTGSGEVTGISSTPFSYETTAGSWKSSAAYTYDIDGKILSKTWETYTPYKRNGVDSYNYNDAGELTHIDKGNGVIDKYTWRNGRIIKSEKIDNEIVKNYIVYDYDVEGNVSGFAIYYLQPEGNFKLGFLKDFLYFTNGNLFKATTWIPDATNPEEFILLSTHTYEGYTDSPNPFPAIEILPNVKAQKNLPTTYTIEEQGLKLQYSFSYTFREDGYPLTRSVSSSYGGEFTTYKYY